jgi:hypothetical protein
MGEPHSHGAIVISWNIIQLMDVIRISKGGQVSVPADVRRRWQTDRLVLEDLGDRLVMRPIPADPVAAALGSLAGPGPSSEEARRRVRRDEASGRRARP